jgi:hypothetical protein
VEIKDQPEQDKKVKYRKLLATMEGMQKLLKNLKIVEI